jgi:hypothetical protein
MKNDMQIGAQNIENLFMTMMWVQSQSNKPKTMLDYKEKQSKLNKYLCFAI